jgi:uncharacterized membrane protein YfcA
MVDWTGPFIAAICVNVVLSALTMPAGIGGGILFVPVLRIIADMSQHEASALSQIFITGASVGSILFQIIWQYRHPKESLLAQPYYVVIMLPVLLSGSTLGVYLHNLLPEIISVIVLLCLCVLSSIIIFKKGMQTYRKENVILHMRERPESPAVNEDVPVPDFLTELDRGISLVSMECGINVAPEAGMSATGSVPEASIESPAQSFMYDETAIIPPSMSEVSIASLRHRRRYPQAASTNSILTPRLLSTDRPEESPPSNDGSLDKKQSNLLLKFCSDSTRHFIAFVVAYWAFSVLFVLLRGSRKNPSFSGIEACSTGYWIVSGVQIAVGIVLSILLSPKEYVLISGTFLTGLVATISGASGGILLNPMLLHRGLDPQQTSATSTVIMLVMASCSALQFLLNGEVEPILSILMLATFAGAVLGMTLVTWIVKKLGRQSVLVFMLGVLVVVGGGMLVFVGVRDVIRQVDAGQNPFALGSIC